MVIRKLSGHFRIGMHRPNYFIPKLKESLDAGIILEDRGESPILRFFPKKPNENNLPHVMPFISPCKIIDEISISVHISREIYNETSLLLYTKKLRFLYRPTHTQRIGRSIFEFELLLNGIFAGKNDFSFLNNFKTAGPHIDSEIKAIAGAIKKPWSKEAADILFQFHENLESM